MTYLLDVRPFRDRSNTFILLWITSILKSVAKGKVAYVGQMAGFGEVIILDHGQRFYSLYGRVGSVSVKRGDIVESGEMIGVISSQNFYFEVRHKGRAENPELYLRSN